MNIMSNILHTHVKHMNNYTEMSIHWILLLVVLINKFWQKKKYINQLIYPTTKNRENKEDLRWIPKTTEQNKTRTNTGFDEFISECVPETNNVARLHFWCVSASNKAWDTLCLNSIILISVKLILYMHVLRILNKHGCHKNKQILGYS